LQETGSGEALFGFMGAQAGGMGLLYVGGRYYDPRTGRFLSPNHDNFDPKRPGTLNPYLSVIFLGPLLLLVGRRLKGKKRYVTIWLLVGFSLTTVLIGCGEESGSEATATPTAGEIQQAPTVTNTAEPTTIATSTPTSTATATAISTPTHTAVPTATCTPTLTAAATSTIVSRPTPVLPSPIWHSFPVRTGQNAQPDWIQWYGFTEYAATRVYGSNAIRIHAGLDFGVYSNRFEPFNAESGTGIPVYAAAFGTVIRVGADAGGLGRVEISFGGALVGYYDHLERGNFPVTSGPVTPDTIIGYLEVTQKHLHLELREGVTVLNPLPYFAAGPRNIMLNWNSTNLTRYQSDWRWFNPLEQPPTTYTTPTPTSTSPPGMD
jgi:RHS repeat-associated protein